jgi:hypothetical protein
MGIKKTAEDADSVGRIMAIGFAQELRKLAEEDGSGDGVDGNANFTAGGPMYGHGKGVKKPPGKVTAPPAKKPGKKEPTMAEVGYPKCR